MHDRKFSFYGGKIINRVSGVSIPEDEPVFIFRARDIHALEVLTLYRQLIKDEHHQAAVEESIGSFFAFTVEHPERMKEPGTSHDFKLAADSALR
jgi:hypothetical protein